MQNREELASTLYKNLELLSSITERKFALASTVALISGLLIVIYYYVRLAVNLGYIAEMVGIFIVLPVIFNKVYSKNVYRVLLSLLIKCSPMRAVYVADQKIVDDNQSAIFSILTETTNEQFDLYCQELPLGKKIEFLNMVNKAKSNPEELFEPGYQSIAVGNFVLRLINQINSYKIIDK